MELTITQLAERIGGELVSADRDEKKRRIAAVGAIETAGENTITFITDARHILKLGKSRAAAVITAKQIEGLNKPQLIVADVNAALIETLNIFAPRLKAAPQGIDPTARIGQKVKIAKSAAIGACVIIDDGVEIGENTVIAGGCKVGQDSKIGKNCRLDSNVVVYHNCIIGNNVIIQANSTIGSTGFGYRFLDGAHRLIPHNGGIIIEDFVEIGANCCIDRAKFDNTIIGAGTKIDNLVQIAHNVIIGKCCLIAGQVGIAGSARLGDGVVLGGAAGVSDHVEVGDGAIVGGRSCVFHDVAAGQQVFGTPATGKTEAIRIIGMTKRLPKLAEQLRQLITRMERLEAAKDNRE
jgi:UDP-3-O-[3-hydroxymyristoyl] glucosamine N-acyltransferase